ncbi:MAG: ABC transporter ATP-binding protein [Epulopiscium sp.]|nr:ABC transporter ATP-binding protein [Candidatus Epulonipiscium sp.]
MNNYFRKGAYVLIALSMLTSCITGVNRIKTEQQYKDLQIAVRYTDLIELSRQKDQAIEVILEELKDKGATTILVRENTLLPNTPNDHANWKAQGKLTTYEGYELLNKYNNISDIEDIIDPELYYVWLTQDNIYGEILKQIEGQGLGGKEILLGQDKYIEYRGNDHSLSTTGMGFPIEDLTIAADLGYTISPQAKEWVGAGEGYVDVFIKSIEEIPNRGPVYFADPEIAGLRSGDKPGIEPEIIEFAKDNQIGHIEFFSEKQKGLYPLFKQSSGGGADYKAVRLHTATDAEVMKLTPKEMLSRYWLAATERNQQVLLFKKANTNNMEDDYERLQYEIEEFANKAESKGYRISNEVKSYNLPLGSFWQAFLSGLGAIIVFMLFFDLLDLRKLGLILGILGTIAYGTILKIKPTLGLQLMALFGASIFPAYAVSWALQKETKTLRETIFLFLRTCLISFGGALTIVGLLSRTSFGLTIDLFVGVKLAHLIPIILVLAGYIYQKYGVLVKSLKEISRKEVTYFSLVIVGFIGVVLIIYTSRTGNTGTVSDLELALRGSLDRILGVRPRTKEFLIGYPLMITIFYYGKQESYLPLLIIAIIGQISLVNTYAHIHTPILISLIRSAYGIVFGIMIGLIFIFIINRLIKVAEKWTTVKR